MLRNFLNESEKIPWDSMKFMTGDINYGGRVTDDIDRLLLLAILKQYYTPDILEDGYRLSKSGMYYAPNLKTVYDYRRFIDTLPSLDAPEVFGMHENANLAFKITESTSIINTILDIQPRTSISKEGKSSDDLIIDLIAEMQQTQPELIDPKDCSKSLFKLNNQGLMH
jgi:dynein heavy chain